MASKREKCMCEGWRWHEEADATEPMALPINVSRPRSPIVMHIQMATFPPLRTIPRKLMVCGAKDAACENVDDARTGCDGSGGLHCALVAVLINVVYTRGRLEEVIRLVSWEGWRVVVWWRRGGRRCK